MKAVSCVSPLDAGTSPRYPSDMDVHVPHETAGRPALAPIDAGHRAWRSRPPAETSRRSPARAGRSASVTRQSGRDTVRQRGLKLDRRPSAARRRRSFPSALWPKAPRVCLLERMACRPTTSLASAWILFCAVSIAASRSCSRRRFSCVCACLFAEHALADPLRHAVDALV